MCMLPFAIFVNRMNDVRNFSDDLYVPTYNGYTWCTKCSSIPVGFLTKNVTFCNVCQWIDWYSKIQLNGSHVISYNGICCSMLNMDEVISFWLAFKSLKYKKLRQILLIFLEIEWLMYWIVTFSNTCSTTHFYIINCKSSRQVRLEKTYIDCPRNWCLSA